MADSRGYPVSSNIRGLKLIVVRFTPALGANPDSDNTISQGLASVTRVSDGKYKVTFNQPIKYVLGAFAQGTAMLPANDSMRMLVTDQSHLDDATTPYCHIEYQEDATPNNTFDAVDLDGGAGEWITLWVFAADTNLLEPSR